MSAPDIIFAGFEFVIILGSIREHDETTIIEVKTMGAVDARLWKCFDPLFPVET
jgi:hypothetical protein